MYSLIYFSDDQLRQARKLRFISLIWILRASLLQSSGPVVPYLDHRKQRVVVDGTFSSWRETGPGVPQESVLGPLLFLIFINDIPDYIRSHNKLFADDTKIYTTIENPVLSAQTLNGELQTIHEWSQTWLVKFNASKTESLIFNTVNGSFYRKLHN